MWNVLVRLYHRLGSPKHFYEMSRYWVQILLIIAIPIVAYGLYNGLFIAPADYQQGDSYRIIYIHVPAAIIALQAYMVMAVAGIFFLVWKMKMAVIVIRSLAPIGTVFTAIALITGSLWGKPTWGTYWQWDARMTSMLILLFMYLGVLALGSALQFNRSRELQDRLISILPIVGSVMVPIIKYSVVWWNSLHQGSTFKLFGKSSMAPEMLEPFRWCIFGFFLLFIALVIWDMRTEILDREKQSNWVKKLFAVNV